MAAPELFEVQQNPSLNNLTHDFGKPNDKQNKFLQTLGAPHVDSFNYLLNEGLEKAVKKLVPVQFALPNGDHVTLSLGDVFIHPPTVPPIMISKSRNILPTECRQRGATYKGCSRGKLLVATNDETLLQVEADLGELPIMVKSERCHLVNLSPAQLIKVQEHTDEWGGYFIVKGHERLIRMLLLTRRNYPIAMARTGWKQRGNLFSDLGVSIRCVMEDQTSVNNVLHFVTDGTAKLMFNHQRNLYFAPIVMILKCLVNVTDEYIFSKLMSGMEDDLYYKGCVINMLQGMHEEGFHTQTEVKAYIGKTFRIRFRDHHTWISDIEICDFIIEHCLAIHLNNNMDKFNLYVIMTQKLFSFAEGKCCEEGADSVMNQEVLLGGHLYLQVVKEKLQSWLYILRNVILKKANSTENFKLSLAEISAALKVCGTLEASLENFLATGSITSTGGLGLMQNRGLTIIVENISRMRYMSHFRSVHRGSFFLEMRTTEARQLLPDAWGFICPVHTPDGTPCGLLNHLSKDCIITTTVDPTLLANIPSILVKLGMIPAASLTSSVDSVADCYLVMLDGRLLGHIPRKITRKLADKLRILKIAGDQVPNTLEVALIPMNVKKGQYPGLFLFTSPARMMRPVINLAANQVELIGTLEQVYLDICIKPEEAYEGLTTHQEISFTSFMSNLACLIPMPDCNQSPRNMYQCQMGKQTMGTPSHTLHIQSDSKLYRLQNPGSPLFRPVHHDVIDLDDFPMGTNALVAVISYTGYDMEDAMIINKSSYERGFAHGSISKSECIEMKSPNSYFAMNPDLPNLFDKLDSDGLPHVGTILKEDDPYYCYYDAIQNRHCLQKWRGKEQAIVDHVRICGVLSRKQLRKVYITVRITRNPMVGDKFASRAGQKGICSQLWPSEDLPFTESGLVPDIIFNPHGFPSRMTIAMMIEIMAGKSAAVHGLVHDATPFKFSEEDTAIHYFGRMLEEGGYNYYGTEKMYSGVDGREMTAAIFFGIVHYQRLRHMVSDKWQVRSTGAIDVLTHQPVKGRRRGGGVRFGEMERDSLLSHGASFLLQDRLFHCSDKSSTFICRNCGDILSPILIANKKDRRENILRCQLCEDKGQVAEMEIPYIFRYFVAQMASVNIKIKIDVAEK